MAYSDIEAWRRIIEEQESEKAAYDEACEKNAAQAAELDEKDFWECGQKEIDPRTLGIEEEGPDDGLCEEFDSDGVDEDIDWSQYQLDEADLREPLTAVSTALDRPASTADLAAQDSVRLMTEAQDAETAMYSLVYRLKELDDEEFDQFMVRLAPTGVNPRRFQWKVGPFDGKTLTFEEFDPDAGPVGDASQTAEEFCEELKAAGVKKLSDVKEMKLLRLGGALDDFRGIVCPTRELYATLVFADSVGPKWKQRFGDMLEGEPRLLDEADLTPGEAGALDAARADDDIPVTDEDWEAIAALKTFPEKV